MISIKGGKMFRRRQADVDRRRIRKPVSEEIEKRGNMGDRRTSLFERRHRYMDRRQGFDEFWMGARDRRLRIMDRRRKGI